MESVKVNVFTVGMPRDWEETITFANRNAYLWGFEDGCRRTGGQPPVPIPDGFAFAWLEYNRRNASSRMAIQDAFAVWCHTETLPGLSAMERGRKAQ
ncbi:hypothetical protein [Amycolatopsis sp. La24]|uniref:hypothetical protein n=1 Tax=Amycolatopsis sp. La24 TaxID=3028304 RepID=UPI0023AFC65A|nr:hypothetical protein [Amycolatopsis sp. La24]